MRFLELSLHLPFLKFVYSSWLETSHLSEFMNAMNWNVRSSIDRVGLIERTYRAYFKGVTYNFSKTTKQVVLEPQSTNYTTLNSLPTPLNTCYPIRHQNLPSPLSAGPKKQSRGASPCRAEQRQRDGSKVPTPISRIWRRSGRQKQKQEQPRPKPRPKSRPRPSARTVTAVNHRGIRVVAILSNETAGVTSSMFRG
jgi:hypothetical protein